MLCHPWCDSVSPLPRPWVSSPSLCIRAGSLDRCPHERGSAGQRNNSQMSASSSAFHVHCVSPPICFCHHSFKEHGVSLRPVGAGPPSTWILRRQRGAESPPPPPKRKKYKQTEKPLLLASLEATHVGSAGSAGRTRPLARHTPAGAFHQRGASRCRSDICCSAPTLVKGSEMSVRLSGKIPRLLAP